MTYELDIMPYGYNIPIKNVYIFAVLDTNENEIIDEGDKIGYHSEDGDYPALLSINEGILNNIPIDFYMDVNYPPAGGQPTSTEEIFVKGTFKFPDDYGPNSPPGYVIIAQADDPDVILNAIC